MKSAKTIAVLPFVNMSAHADAEYFSDGMTEELINALTKIKGLKVTSRTSSFYFKNKSLPLPQIAQELQVTILLEGSVRLSGKKMRITAQLIDAEEDVHFWSETFDRSVEDVFAVQDEISLTIADKLREQLGHFEIESQLVHAPDLPVELYQQYLKGRYHLMKLTLAETEIAIALFEEVIAQQPDFALAHLGINQGYAFLGTMGQLPALEAFTKAQPFLEQAIRLGEQLPEVQLNLSWIACWQRWDLAAAYQHITQALETRPSDEMYITLANFLTVEGKLEAAHRALDKALELAPLTAMNHHYQGFLYYLQEQFEQVFPCLEKSLQLKPDLPFPPLYWGESLLLTGKVAAGLAYFRQLPLDVAGDLTSLGGSTLAYAEMGKVAEAEAGLAQLRAALQTDARGSAMNFLIMCHTRLGQHEAALDLIEQGIGEHLPMMLLLGTEPMLKPLRAIPRFQALWRQALGEPTEFDFSPRKYKQSLLDESSLTQHRQALIDLMETDRLYLDSTLSLRGLAERIGIPANHLSQLLNEGFQQNFSEFVNTYRLQQFQTMVADPAQRHLTILALAFESGFNSKTVFNTFFKKTMGITPRAYWKSIVSR